MKLFKLTLLILAFAFISVQDLVGSSVITDALSEQMDQKSETELIRINIRMNEQYNLNNIKSELLTMEKEERRDFVISELQSFRDESQGEILQYIRIKNREGKTELIHSLWITNTITCLATKDVINELAQRMDIDRIDWDEKRKMLIGDNKSGSGGNDNGGKEITWNVTHIDATDVWALGYTGAGIVVGVLDTGVNYDHLDLADHLWTNPTYPNHGYDFVNDDDDPMDDHGHGTHCAGTVAGDGTAGSQTGMAPDATIMCVKVLDAGGGGTESGVWAAIQFTVDNGGDVISMSLGWQHSWGVDRESWRNSFDNALAAGVISAVAAGNEGDQQGSYPIPDNVRTPGDVPPPWLNPDQTLTGGTSGVVCVGATDSGDNASSFTSQGPVEWESISPFNDYAYGSGGLIRPDVAAPGSNIKSLDYSSNTGYADGWSGTSMATPAVAGVMALMLDKNPYLTAVEINMALETTALDLGAAGKDNIFGAGRINALSAVNAVSGPGPVYNSHTIDDSNGNNNGEVEADENILLSLDIINNSNSAHNGVTVDISTTSPYITITDNTEYYGNFTIGQNKNIVNGFAFDVANNTPGMEEIQFEIEASNAFITWNSQFSIITSGPALQFGNMTISDPTGNNNGRLDPGETADITVPVLNIGNGNSPSASAMLSSISTYVTINSGSASLGVIPAGNSANAIYNITCDGATPIGTAVDLTVDVDAGNFDISKTFYQSVGLILEDWESGNFFSFPWEFAGTADWFISTTDPYEGMYCAQSGVISHNQTSELVINVETTNDDNISFFRKVSSESNYDYLQFYIDGTQQEQWSGEVAWSEVSYFVSAGVHEFKWVYSKDGSVSTGSDCGWVDFIIFPSIVPPPAPPAIGLSDLGFEVTVPPGGNTTEVLTISNVGEADLMYSLSKYYHPTDGIKAYCTSEGGGGDEFIQNVTIGDINNTTGQDYYADYTAMSTVVAVGQSYDITITNGDPIWTSDECGIWVDWNQNEDFYDDDPIVVSGTPGVGPYTATITPPAGALPGLARMRVQIIYSATPDPCLASFSYGEVEDYSLNVNSNFVDWLTINPMTGTIGEAGSDDIDFIFDATDLTEGDYFADVTVSSNDPDQPNIVLPCTLHVAVGSTISGTISYPNSGTPLNNCTVMLYNDADVLVGQTNTNASGYYELTAIANGNYTLVTTSSLPYTYVTALSDLNIVVSHLLGIPLTGLYFLAAEVSGDGGVGLDDYNLMGSNILGSLVGYPAVPEFRFEDQNVTVSGGDVTKDFGGIMSGDATGDGM